MSTLRHQILTRAREIITDEKDWTYGTTRQRMRKHTRYCAFGAILKASREITGFTHGSSVIPRQIMQRIVYVNDNLGHTMVLAYLDELIEDARPEEETKPRLKLVHSQAAA
jgi:hypothetical protein